MFLHTGENVISNFKPGIPNPGASGGSTIDRVIGLFRDAWTTILDGVHCLSSTSRGSVADRREDMVICSGCCKL